jgi:hypothetical protein
MQNIQNTSNLMHLEALEQRLSQPQDIRDEALPFVNKAETSLKNIFSPYTDPNYGLPINLVFNEINSGTPTISMKGISSPENSEVKLEIEDLKKGKEDSRPKMYMSESDEWSGMYKGGNRIQFKRFKEEAEHLENSLGFDFEINLPHRTMLTGIEIKEECTHLVSLLRNTIEAYEANPNKIILSSNTEYEQSYESLEHIDRLLSLLVTRAAYELGMFKELEEKTQSLVDSQNPLGDLPSIYGTTLNRRITTKLDAKEDILLNGTLALIGYQFNSTINSPLLKLAALRFGIGYLPKNDDLEGEKAFSTVVDIVPYLMEPGATNDDVTERMKTYLKYMKNGGKEDLLLVTESLLPEPKDKLNWTNQMLNEFKIEAPEARELLIEYFANEADFSMPIIIPPRTMIKVKVAMNRYEKQQEKNLA